MQQHVTALGIKIESVVWLERSTLAATALGLAVWVTGWQPLATLSRPIVWILHFSYLWLSMGLALLAMAQLGWVTASYGVHALAVASTGGLIIGMMKRLRLPLTW